MNKWLKKIKRFVLEKLLKPMQSRLKIRQLKKQHHKKIKQLTNQYAKLSKIPSTWQRAFWVFLAGVVALGLMMTFGFIYWEGWSPTFKEIDSKSIVQLSNLIIVAPIAFIVWFFRDQNHLRALSNARKDTNLKEFQQLQEWATGSGEAKDNEALQISALHSLRGYLKGEYGEDFRRGAFEIFTSALRAQHQKILVDINNEQKPAVNSIKTAIENDELCKQLNRIAQEDWFNLLINHNFPTATISLVGVDLSNKYLRCKQYGTPLNLSSANLQGVDLRWAQLQGVDLYKAQLQGADLRWAQLQGVDLYKAQLQGADLRWAQLQGADLSWAQLQGVDLYKAQLQGAELQGVQLQGAELQGVQLQGTHLYKAQLQGAYIGRPLFEVLSFEERINQQTDKETESEELIEQYKPLNNEEKQALIDQLKKINSNSGVTDVISDALDLSNTKTGKYNKQQAQAWINKFNQSR
jgi:uncharacterized protein YjbI with pentapeptide repeats